VVVLHLPAQQVGVEDVRGRELLGVLQVRHHDHVCAEEALSGDAVVFQEGIGDEADEGGEGDLLLVGAAAVAVEDLVEKFMKPGILRLGKILTWVGWKA
jgi:hypothetical protein